jgi:putative spermidine/putrescine transport system substrate-binding protein
MRSGYYSPVQEPSRAHVSPGEYAYWIEGLPADADYEGFGGVVVRKGEVRAGGSFARRACRIAAWNSNHPEIGYAAERWGEIVAG